MYCYRKGLLTSDNALVTVRVVGCIAIISAYFMLFRGRFPVEKCQIVDSCNLGIGRYVNPSYKKFIEEYYTVKNNSTPEARQVMEKKRRRLNYLPFLI
jgi:hypothetical protein